MDRNRTKQKDTPPDPKENSVKTNRRDLPERLKRGLDKVERDDKIRREIERREREGK